jgi:K+/H+ antiporter YhaU regulatory subunit KhtT
MKRLVHKTTKPSHRLRLPPAPNKIAHTFRRTTLIIASENARTKLEKCFKKEREQENVISALTCHQLVAKVQQAESATADLERNEIASEAKKQQRFGWKGRR